MHHPPPLCPVPMFPLILGQSGLGGGNPPFGGGGGGGGPPPPGGGVGFSSPFGARPRDAYKILRSKDFLGVDKFDGDLTKFADWSDRVKGKICNAHHRFQSVLAAIEGEYIEKPITAAIEDTWVADGFAVGIDVKQTSAELYDVLVDRTTSSLLDKRKLAQGRGFEFWRILVHDFGTASTDAQAVRLQNYMQPVKTTGLADLCVALDRWKTLGAELGRPIEDDFKLIALKQLVPPKMAELIATQESLKQYPAALAFVERQISSHRHAGQVTEVQRMAKQVRPVDGSRPVPMDLSAMIEALENLQGGPEMEETEESEDHGAAACSDDPLAAVVAALRGAKGGGKGSGKSGGRNSSTAKRPFTCECFNCGKKGHMAVDCRQPKKERPKGGGKGRGVSSLEAAAGEEEEVTNAIGSTYALTIPPRDVASLNACMPPAETWTM